MARPGSTTDENYWLESVGFVLKSTMKKTIWQNLAFLFPYFLFLLISGTFLLFYEKGEAHLYINQYRFDPGDYFFSYITHLGDGLAATILVALLFFVKYRYAFFIGISNLIASLITQTLKHTVFADDVRPKKYFEGISDLKLITWIENYSYNSFPSGHATTAFATFFCLSLLIENKALKFVMFLLALIIGFSRVYLSQHFLSDVCAGSFIGVIVALLTYQFIFQAEKIKNRTWLEGSLLKKN